MIYMQEELNLQVIHHPSWKPLSENDSKRTRDPKLLKTAMPPKRRNLPNSSSKELTKEPCCVCCQLITIGKDEALFCSGNCQQWMHRYCASVSVKCYSDMTAKDTPFFCLCCQEGKNTLEIAVLKETVERLKQEIAALRVPL